ncbi:viral A-type inclusion protein [Reticulomyxa filosa]|uniref:Viral A-type inclusion protein n=1 Tax=Reticulomyxa filosa TaxID=46433 RepID=X6NXE6_RETFI|nr:viral A-type inclusion protein [Reticulomyxa filosa]|eukprot:ETO30494.1 viral A-type inclusion protein [Reticulomyxa filosa]
MSVLLFVLNKVVKLGPIAIYLFQINTKDEPIDLLNKKDEESKVELVPRKDGDGYEWNNLTKASIRQISDLLKYMHSAFNNRKYVIRYDIDGDIDAKQFSEESPVGPSWDSGRSHIVVILRLMESNVYFLKNVQQQPQGQKRRSQFTLVDCAGYSSWEKKLPKLDKNETDALKMELYKRDSQDFRSLNTSFIHLGALLTSIPKKARGDQIITSSMFHWKKSLLTQALHCIATWLEKPSSRLSRKTQDTIDITDYSPRVVLKESTYVFFFFYNAPQKKKGAKKKKDETLATLRFGNFPLVDPMLLLIIDKYQSEIAKLQASKLENTDAGVVDSNVLQKMEELEQEANEMKAKYNALRKEHNKLKTRSATKMEELTDVRNKYEQLESQYQLKNSQYIQLQELYKQSKSNEQFLREDLDEVRQQLNHLSTDNLSKADPTKIDPKIQRIKQHIQLKQVIQLIEIETVLAAVRQELVTTKKESEQFQQHLKAANQEIAKLKANCVNRDEVQLQLQVC